MHSKNVRELTKKFQAAITDHVENNTSVEVAREILAVLADAYEDNNLPRAAFIASHLAKLSEPYLHQMLVKRYKAKYPLQGN